MTAGPEEEEEEEEDEQGEIRQVSAIKIKPRQVWAGTGTSNPGAQNILRWAMQV